MNFIIDKWYKTNDGYHVKFIVNIMQDGMYHIFRHTKENDYAPYYTDESGKTAYGSYILEEII